MNITQLARQLNVSPEELRTKLPELGFDIGMRAIKIDDVVAGKVKRSWAHMVKQQKREAALAERETKNAPACPADSAPKNIRIPSKIRVSAFADTLGIPVVKLMTELMKNGIMASMHEEIDYETAYIIAEDMGITAERSEEDYAHEISASLQKLHALKEKDDKTRLVPRPPVVVVMGHVDHGKTTLLDAIRKTNVVGGESGGITQHIGAYQVTYKNKKITFLDTPGHEAFSAMRARGGRVADLAILVVAADDGLKPQTIESIKVIQEEGLDFIVAINKIDKPGTDPERVKAELANINLTPHDWGGTIPCVLVSAKTHLHLDKLLDELVVLAELRDLKAATDGRAYGTVIESHIDEGYGPLATILIQSGTLHLEDLVRIGRVAGKIKLMKNFEDAPLKNAGPAVPVQIIGLKSAPAVGDIMEVVESKKYLKNTGKSYSLFVSENSEKAKSAPQKQGSGEVRTPKIQLPLIVRADVLGSLEALLDAIQKIRHEKIELKIIQQGLGHFTEKDVRTAEDSRSLLIGFHAPLSAGAKHALAQAKQTSHHSFKVIYELLDFLKERVNELAPPEIIQTTLGKIKILAAFRKDRTGHIVGGVVQTGKAALSAHFYVLRNEKIVGEGEILELQLHKKPAQEANEGTECGLKVKSDSDILEGDILDIFAREERKIKI